MLRVIAKTYLMVAVCSFAFLCSPFAFPAVLLTGFAIWSLPYAIGAFREPAQGPSLAAEPSQAPDARLLAEATSHA